MSNFTFEDSFKNGNINYIMYRLYDNFYMSMGTQFDNILHVNFVYELDINISQNILLKDIQMIYKALQNFWALNENILGESQKIYYEFEIISATNHEPYMKDRFVFDNLISPKTHNKALSILLLIRIFTCLYINGNIKSNSIEKIVGFVRLNKDCDLLLSTIKAKDIENVFNEL